MKKEKKIENEAAELLNGENGDAALNSENGDTAEELLAEGRKMGNCVGCGTYGRGIVYGRCLIVMVRDEHGRPYVDIEIDRASWKVRQCYSRHNQPAPENVHALANALAVKFRQMSKRRKAS